jgi:hypothetical protein
MKSLVEKQEKENLQKEKLKNRIIKAASRLDVVLDETQINFLDTLGVEDLMQMNVFLYFQVIAYDHLKHQKRMEELESEYPTLFNFNKSN